MNKSTYNKVARILNDHLGVNDFIVVDTSEVDKQFCDKYSIRVSDNSWDLYWRANVIDQIDDILTSQLGVYIEPYNKRLLNVAEL